MSVNGYDNIGDIHGHDLAVSKFYFSMYISFV